MTKVKKVLFKAYKKLDLPSWTEFARQLSIPQATLSSWINTERQPNFDMIQKLCTGLNKLGYEVKQEQLR